MLRLILLGAFISVLGSSARANGPFEYSFTDMSGALGSLSGGGVASADVTLSDLSGADLATAAFSFGVTFDGSILTVDSIAPAPILEALNGGNGPEFFVENAFVDGLNVGCLYSFPGLEEISFTTPSPVIELAFTVNGGPVPTITPISTVLEFSELVGNPPMAMIVAVAGVSESACGIPGELVVEPLQVNRAFRRGDLDGDGFVWGSDNELLSGWLFAGDLPPTPGCLDAYDINDDGFIDPLDLITLLAFLLSPNPPPLPDPFATCGFDPTDDALDCLRPKGCP